MGKIKRMDQVRLIIQTYLATNSLKATARRLLVSKNTVKNYVRKGEAYNQDLSQLLSLPQSELIKVFYEAPDKQQTEREQVFTEKIAYWIKELRRVGVTKYLLWEEYREEYPNGYGYTQFCEHLKREIGRRDLTLAITHLPGQIMQVDFAGKKIRWVDPATGEVHDCEVLIAVMPHSQYTFAIALPSQKVEDFVHGLNQALLFFGRLPQAILSDNLKSYVTRADRYDPTFNELCRQLAVHYQIDLQATRVAKPKDKASVENMVSTAYTRLYAPLRNKVFYSLAALNKGLLRQLLTHNTKPYQKKEGNRKAVFEQYELPEMEVLPSDLFIVKKVTKAKVRRDYHVYVGEEKNYYSVPYRYVGKNTTVIYTRTTVEVYLDTQRIAIHQRLLYRDAYQYQTQDNHMPKNHSEWKKARGFNGAYFLKEAEKVGKATYWVVKQVLVSKRHEAQSYNACQGIFHLAKKYTPQRLEKAALRCQKVSKASYTMLKRILVHKLDQEEETPNLFTPPIHDNIRGPEAYQ